MSSNAHRCCYSLRYTVELNLYSNLFLLHLETQTINRAISGFEMTTKPHALLLLQLADGSLPINKSNDITTPHSRPLLIESGLLVSAGVWVRCAVRCGV